MILMSTFRSFAVLLLSLLLAAEDGVAMLFTGAGPESALGSDC